MEIGKIIPRLDVKVQDDTFIVDCLKVINAVRPEWFDSYNIEGGIGILAKIFTEGITNKVIGFSLITDPSATVLLKIYGENTDLMIEREEEIGTMMLLHKAGGGAELYAAFENGISYEFTPGVTLSLELCYSPSVYPLVATQLARLHTTLQIILGPGQTKVETGVWKKIELFIELNRHVLENNQEIRDRLHTECGFYLEKVKAEIEELKDLLEGENMPVAFCHNDVIRGNVVYNEGEQRVTFIDYEYAMANYTPFDVAAHFLGFVGTDTSDFSVCPAPEFTSKWISEYLKGFESKEFTTEEFARRAVQRYKEFSKEMEALKERQDNNMRGKIKQDLTTRRKGVRQNVRPYSRTNCKHNKKK